MARTELGWGNKMIVYKGKAKDLTRQSISKAWLKFTRPIEPLEPVDFGKN